MPKPWASLFEAARFGWEVQCVIALRLMRLAGGGALAQREATRMTSEKARLQVTRNRLERQVRRSRRGR